jgi:hypothetical protein
MSRQPICSADARPTNRRTLSQRGTESRCRRLAADLHGTTATSACWVLDQKDDIDDKP